MKVVILCGGAGTRLREETEVRPKPMVEIGERPILWHIMKIYAHYGYNDFVLCLGYKGEVIKNYFLNYEFMDNDFTINLETGDTKIPFRRNTVSWRVTLADTGLNAMTGARVKRIERYIDGPEFMLTYGDGVTDLDIRTLVEFHQAHGKIGTVTGVSPASRYGELRIKGDRVTSFREKPQTQEAFISGGYFVFKREFFDLLSEEDDCVLEREPLERLAAQGELMVYTHQGFWQCMDTARDLDFLRTLWSQGPAPWKIWHE
ncbi:MAG: glucose-1-phosphate cytidylyltransferase [Dehalococcoidia bacterium]